MLYQQKSSPFFDLKNVFCMLFFYKKSPAAAFSAEPETVVLFVVKTVLHRFGRDSAVIYRFYDPSVGLNTGTEGVKQLD